LEAIVSSTYPSSRDRYYLSLVCYYSARPINALAVVEGLARRLQELFQTTHVRGWPASTLAAPVDLVPSSWREDDEGRFIVTASEFPRLREVRSLCSGLGLEGWYGPEPPEDEAPAWQIDCSLDPIIKRSVSVAPALLIILHLQRLSKKCMRRLWSDCLTWVRAAAELAPVRYGLIDVADVSETACGLYYSGMSMGYVTTLRQQIENAWLRNIAEGHFLASGVYWGNILGPELLQGLERGGEFATVRRLLGSHRDSVYERLPHDALLIIPDKNLENYVFPFSGLLLSGEFDLMVELRRAMLRAGLLA
jgi:hypothetical protein